MNQLMPMCFSTFLQCPSYQSSRERRTPPTPTRAGSPCWPSPTSTDTRPSSPTGSSRSCRSPSICKPNSQGAQILTCMSSLLHFKYKHSQESGERGKVIFRIPQWLMNTTIMIGEGVWLRNGVSTIAASFPTALPECHFLLDCLGSNLDGVKIVF